MGNNENIAAVIVAAGFSSRLPGFKPLLPLGSGTMIEAIIQSLRVGGVSDITVVTGHQAAELIPELDRLGVRHVHNPDYHDGMFSSVVAGVSSFSSQIDAFFMLPGDMPLVRGHTIHLLRDAYRHTRAPVIYPVFRQRRGHPPLISARLFPAITSWNRPGGLRSLLALHETQAMEVQTEDQGILLDVDTEEDYARARQLFPHLRGAKTQP